jgi:hypothetical protein
MNLKLYSLSIVVMAVIVFTQVSFSRVSISVFLVAALIFWIPFYFAARRGQPPTKSETVMATLWMWFRRLLCWFAAVGFASGGIYLMLNADLSKGLFESIFVPLFVLWIAAFLAYVGLVGQGLNRAQFLDDLRLYRENKKRYKWKW